MNLALFLLIIISVSLALVLVIVIRKLVIIKKQITSVVNMTKACRDGQKYKLFLPVSSPLAELSEEIADLSLENENKLIELENSEKSTKELLTSLSHDIRTPLTTLLGYLDALDDGFIKLEERSQGISNARKKAYRMKEYIDELFYWCKLNSKELVINKKVTDINELTREIIVDFLPVLEKNNIKLKANIADGELNIIVDPDAYKRILENLIQNALSHAYDETENKEMVISVLDSKKVIVSVADNGIGIPPEKLPFVFSRLYKCDSARTEKGSGLGLSIVKELTELLGGTVNIINKSGTSLSSETNSSKSGTGCVFIVTLNK